MKYIVHRALALVGLLSASFLVACVADVDEPEGVEEAQQAVIEPDGSDGTCAVYSGTRCYWMENYTGNYCWIPYRIKTIEQCQSANGYCNKGGGCFKWADGSDQEPYP